MYVLHVLYVYASVCVCVHDSWHAQVLDKRDGVVPLPTVNL